MRSRYLVICVLSTLILLCPIQASAGTPKLRRGVNLSHWYAQTMKGHYDEATHLATYNTEKDAQNIADMGFDHVRWTFDPSVLFTNTPGKLNDANVSKMKERMGWYLSRKMAIILDCHPVGDFVNPLANNDAAAQDKFCKDWAALAAAMKDIDSNMLAFEILNEPEPMTGDYWRELQGRAMEAVRKAAPDHAIVAAPGRWDGVDELTKMRPYDMPNVIYTFHYYEPQHFTHQGASWNGPMITNLHDLPWPVDPSKAREVADKAGDKTAEGKKNIHWQILQGEFTPEYMNYRMAEVAVWQRKAGNPPILVGEWGVYKAITPRESVLAWRKAAREAFERYNFAWTTWDYAGGFSIVDEKTREPDVEMLKALGLK